MYTPTPGDVHVNTPLTQISIAYLQNQTEFVAAQVCPIIPVTKQSDRYYVYNRGDFFRDQMQRRALASNAGKDNQLEVRIGIERGEVVVGNIGQRGQYTEIGDAMNAAN